MSNTYAYDITGLFDTLTMEEVLEQMYGHNGDTFKTGEEIAMEVDEDVLMKAQQILHTLKYDKIELVIDVNTGQVTGVNHDD